VAGEDARQLGQRKWSKTRKISAGRIRSSVHSNDQGGELLDEEAIPGDLSDRGKGEKII